MALLNVKELLTTGAGTQGTLLIVRKIYDTLWDEHNKNLIGRQYAAFIAGPADVPGSSLDLDTVDIDTLEVFKVAEGAVIPSDNAAYSTSNIRPVKYAVRPLVTREMIEDGKWNLIQHNVKLAGKKMAENENNLVLTALDGAGNTVTGGAAITIANLSSGVLNLRNNDFTPKVLFIGPEVLSDLQNIDTFHEADKLGSREMFDKGYVGRLLGMDVVMFSANAAPTTAYTRRAYVVDSDHAYCIVEKRPVSVEDYSDVPSDTQGVVVTQRIAVSTIRTNAICLITTT